MADYFLTRPMVRTCAQQGACSDQNKRYRNVSHHGFWAFNWLTPAPSAEIDAACQEIVAPVTSGDLTADIDSSFRVEQYADARRRAEHYRRRGKVLFVFGDSGIAASSGLSPARLQDCCSLPVVSRMQIRSTRPAKVRGSWPVLVAICWSR